MLFMLKEVDPIGHATSPQGEPVSYVKECFAQFIQQVAIGTPPEKMGLTTRQALKTTRFLKAKGIDVPTNNAEWGATPMERRIAYVLGSGDVTQKQAARVLGITHEDVRAHLKNMRKPDRTYPLPGIPRAKWTSSFTKRK